MCFPCVFQGFRNETLSRPVVVGWRLNQCLLGANALLIKISLKSLAFCLGPMIYRFSDHLQNICDFIKPSFWSLERRDACMKLLNYFFVYLQLSEGRGNVHFAKSHYMWLGKFHIYIKSTVRQFETGTTLRFMPCIFVIVPFSILYYFYY